MLSTPLLPTHNNSAWWCSGFKYIFLFSISCESFSRSYTNILYVSAQTDLRWCYRLLIQAVL